MGDSYAHRVYPISMTRIVYLSFDRFPSSKGAATHIDAFASALGERFGCVDLLTVPAESMAEIDGPIPHFVPNVPQQLADSTRHWGAVGVNHFPISADGTNLFERVLSFRQHCWHWWRQRLMQPSVEMPIVHFRSIFEGYPIARHKDQFCRKLVYEVNGLPSIELKYRYPGVADDKELIRKLRYQEDVCLAASDIVLTVSQVNAEHLVSRGLKEDQIRVIPNGVDTDLFAYRAADSNRTREIAAGSPVKMLYCGTMSSWQGVGIAIDALALYRRDFPATLTLVGLANPRQRRDLMQLAWELGVSDHVMMLDPVPKPELVILHHEADVVVAPLTRNDRNLVQGCCPLKVIEAMSCGTPLVASDLPVVRELAGDDVEALLVRPGSGKAIKDAMLRLRMEPGLGCRLSRSARMRAERDFTWRKAQQSLIQSYEELL